MKSMTRFGYRPTLAPRREMRKLGAKMVDRYGKAWELQVGDETVLMSYGTRVAAIRGGEFIRLWDGFTPTTVRHASKFRERHGIKGIEDDEWLAMPVDSRREIEG